MRQGTPGAAQRIGGVGFHASSKQRAWRTDLDQSSSGDRDQGDFFTSRDRTLAMPHDDPKVLREQLARCWQLFWQVSDPVQMANALFMIRELEERLVSVMTQEFSSSLSRPRSRQV
jgi:hypothetical protein